jgi:hypothetical protein
MAVAISLGVTKPVKGLPARPAMPAKRFPRGVEDLLSGRRVHSRYQRVTPWAGQMCISRDVTVQVDGTSNEIAVLSDAPGVVDEELTLALVSSDGNMDLRVKVVDSRPQIVEGMLRHRLRLQLLAAQAPEADDRSTQ